jgi:hypothetical protein
MNDARATLVFRPLSLHTLLFYFVFSLLSLSSSLEAEGEGGVVWTPKSTSTLPTLSAAFYYRVNKV